MELGERIRRLRTARNLSQGDLADALEVSRQSVSRWETDSAVPELEKLMKLSHIFGVTLDELVTGNSPQSATAEEPPPPETPPASAPAAGSALAGSAFPPRKIVGTILLCMGGLMILLLTLMGGLLEGLVLSVPFWLCGFICLFARKHPGLWCAWAMYAVVDLFLRYATGNNWRVIFLTLKFELQMNDINLLVGWGQFLVMILLIFATAIRFRRYKITLTRQVQWALIGSWALFFLLQIPINFVMREQWFWNVYPLVDWVRLVFFTVLLTVTTCALPQKAKN